MKILQTVSPQCQKLWLEVMNMKENTAEVIDFEEAVQAKINGSGGGYDHFTGMTTGTRFASIPNGAYTSECDEYILLVRQGPTVLLQNISPREGFQDQERHIGSKFWKLNTLVQILHIPDASETGPPPLPVEGRITNGNSPED